MVRRRRCERRYVVGYKHGIPLDVDLVFDCRFLPNPHWVEELQPRRGSMRPFPTMCWSNRSRVRSWPPRTFAGADPSVLCAGGKSYDRCVRLYRWPSPVGRNRGKVAEALDKLGHAPAIVHRDIDK